LANVLFSKGIKLVDKVEGSLILTIEPVFNPIPVAIICGEMMGLRAIMGSVIVIVFVALYSVLSGKSEKQNEPAN
ncbi:MAG: EamA family transporter, partial [Acutalibacteraceae bacterium]